MKRNAQRIFVPSIIVLVILVLVAFFAWRASKLARVSKVEKPEKQAKTEISPAKPTLAHGKQVYEIITDKPRDPQIIEVEVDPLDVEFGETQTVTVKIKTKADSVRAEDFVLGTTICDQKEIEFPLKLKKVEGNGELVTTWQGKWEREKECTFEKNYQIKIFAKNIKGEDKVTISFGSSCPTPTDGQDYTLSTSTVGSEGCIFEWHINGVEKGNIIIESGFTLTVGGGSVGEQTIVFNPGYSITIDGVIAISKEGPGQIRKAYIWWGDSDSDGYNAYYVHDDPTNPPVSGAVRRYTLASLTDPECDDSNDNIFQEVANLSKDRDRDGYLNPTPDTGVHCVGTSTTVDSRTYYKDANGNFSWLVNSQKFGTDDCDDSNSYIFTYFSSSPPTISLDSDRDGYTASSPTGGCVGCSAQINGRTYYQGDDGTYKWLYDNDKLGTNDCDDGNANIFQSISGLSSDNDQDGYTDTAAGTQCVGDSTTTDSRTYYKDSSGNYTWLVDSEKLGTDDCDDADNTRWQYKECYLDGDNDGYRVSASAMRCVGSDCTNSTDNYKRESSAPLDCCDLDARVNSGAGYQTSLGDWVCTDYPQWDFNCNGSVEKQYTSISTISCTYSGGSCIKSGSEGWADTVPNCGESDTWEYGCKPLKPPLEGCILTTQTRTQGCR